MKAYDDSHYEFDIMKKGKSFIFYLLKIDAMDRSRTIDNNFKFTSSVLSFAGFSESGNVKFKTNCKMGFELNLNSVVHNNNVWSTHYVSVADKRKRMIKSTVVLVDVILTMRAMQYIYSVLTIKDKADIAEKMLEKDRYNGIRKWLSSMDEAQRESFPNITWDKVVEVKKLWIEEKNAETSIEESNGLWGIYGKIK